MDSAQIRVIKPFVGGGFGHRVEPLNFEMVTAALARAAGGTVKTRTVARGRFSHPPRPARDRHPAQARHEEERRDHRGRLRGHAARRRVRRLRAGDDPLRRRAAARAVPARRRQVPRPPRLHQYAAVRRDARARRGGCAARVRVAARQHGARARARPVRRAPRQPDHAAVAHAQRPAGQFLRHPAMPRLGRAGLGLEGAPRQVAARMASSGALAWRVRTTSRARPSRCTGAASRTR